MLVVSATITLTYAPDFAVAQPRIDSLGTFYIVAASGDGASAVGTDDSDTRVAGAARWTESGGLSIIRPPITDGQVTVAGYSANGRYAVGAEDDDWGGDSIECDPRQSDNGWTREGRAFSWIWSETSGLIRLDPTTDFCYSMVSISNTGIAVGAYNDTTDTDLEASVKAAIWNGSFSSIHPTGFDISQASAISADGSTIVGWVALESSPSDRTAVIFEPAGPRTLFAGVPHSVSDDGSVIVGVSSDNTLVRWEGGTTTTLVSSGFFPGRAYVSGDGKTIVAGGFGTFGPHRGPHTRVFLEDGTDESLWQLLIDRGVDVGSWLFSSPGGVSEDGGTIFGWDSLKPSAFRVVFPNCAEEAIGWTASSGDFDDGGNWENGSVPPDTSVVAFDNGGSSYTVTLGGDRTDSEVMVPSDVVLLQLAQSDYTLTGTCSGNSIDVASGGSLTLSDGDVLANRSVRVSEGLGPELILTSQANLMIDADADGSGSLSAGTSNGNALVKVEMGTSIDSPNRTVLGLASGESGELFVDGAFTGGDIEVGSDGDGELVVDGNGFVVADRVRAGVRSGAGVITVDGGRLDTDEVILSDGAGSGPSSLTVINLAELTIGTLTVGGAAGSNGSVTLTGSNLNVDVMTVGRHGVGNVTIGGGSFTNTASPKGRFVLGLQGGSLGAMSIDGAQTELIGQSMVVGEAGEGDLRISGGPFVAMNRIFVASQAPGYLELDASSTLVANFIDWGPEATIVLGGIFLVGPNPAAPKRGSVEEFSLRSDTLNVRGVPSVTADSVAITEGGVLGGSGTYPFDLVSGGTVNPGAPAAAGTLTVGGNYSQAVNGILEVDIGGPAEGEYDRLVINGEAALSGTLRVARLGEFLPQIGEAFEVVQAGSITGIFDAIEIADFRADVIYEATAVMVVVTSGVATEEMAAIPVEFVLHQNYPNPFNPATTISYALPQTADVELTVVDVLGRQVRELASGTKPAGTFEISFDAGALPSGIYFYRLQAGDYVETKRMVVVK